MEQLAKFLKGAGDTRLDSKDAQPAGQLRPAEGEDYKYRFYRDADEI